ncbi:hypothetical protein [Lentzea sp.]|uniref:hypothetical protein n=1 Tax=Lentzea sp. TaxID=56099 RepID=UPI002C8941B4|nr:hypothetical protein [Lentzea sp.]HUQ61945.1 hypothetical protein [Lentzea sp.]
MEVAGAGQSGYRAGGGGPGLAAAIGLSARAGALTTNTMLTSAQSLRGKAIIASRGRQAPAEDVTSVPRELA